MNNITSLVFASIFIKLNQKTLVKLSSIVNIQRGIENLKKKDALDAITSTKSTIRKLIAVDNIERFRIKWKAASFYQKYIDYSKSTYPKGSKVNLKQDSWFKQEKIVLKRISNKLVAALDTKKEKKEDYFYTLDSVQMIWMIDKKSYNIRLILAILNSEFMNLYYTTLFSYKKLFSKIQKIFLEELPIPVNIDPNLEKQIVDKVKKLEKKFIKKDYDELNDLVKSLYFSKDELKQFEKSLKLTYNLKDLPGLGYNHEYELNKYGIKSIDDLIKCDVNDIIDNVPGVGAKTIEKWIKYGKELNK
ncbi:MAG: hypothetical protein CEE42_02170 [Promethearchaeota archaeon Loki_b31]|nr:MAG: hypothetical protein CEE42_02170 [Candidatus Lokiarchaeota archaeon Loki_b31]